ncbi:TonB-dependent receptor [Flavobacterium sp. SOK18b]|uniref:TonB-dependent receptor plug domain-containing protein n=1 Tax=Flavobacterium sp. SOK18b TaxID=797900 RepID=UPI0015F980FB|nr:TonB-dependent receptor [Flavobacterium sp. SOK18b]MBB1194429.1 TonB-dependent receptor [Flavobacterium sp. SOK18b]
MKKLFIWCMLFAITIIHAQQDLTVQIVDAQTNAVVPSITISILNKSQNSSISQVSNSKGNVIFKNISSLDGYQINFLGNQEYAAQESKLFDIRSNQNAIIEIRLNKKSANELQEVLVTGKSNTKINRRDAEVSFELKAKEISEIPIEGRDITRVLYRLPNVTQATGFFPESPNVSINGANGLYTSYLIDGMDNNERFLGGQKFAITSGFAKDVTVLTSNFSAEYGLTGSGVIDVTTKSGSNTFTGESYFITRPGPAIDGKSSFAQRDLSGNQVKDGFARYQAGGAVGGAFVKDKTFYFFNFEHTTDVKDNLLNVPDLGIASTIRGTNTFDYFSAKIDQIWNPNFKSSLRANVGLVNIENQGGGLNGGVSFPSAGNSQLRNSALISLKNAYTIQQISAETNVQYSRFRWDYSNANNGPAPQVVVLNPNDETIAVLGNPGYNFDALENTIQLQQKFKYYTDKHTIKFGFGLISANHELLGGGNPNGNYTVKLTSDQINTLRTSGVGSSLNIEDIPSNALVTNYNVELRPAVFGTTQNVYSAYIEDLWSVNQKLNLVLGLRYDYDNLSKGGAEKGDFNNLAPRLNLNYKLNENSSLRGGYGIAFDKINYAIYSDALQQNTTSISYAKQLQQFIDLGILPSNTNINAITFNGNISANVASVPYLQGPSGASLQGQRENAFSNERRILNPNGYDNPYTHQFTLGYQTQINEDKLFFADFVHNRGENQFRLRNLNAAAAYTIDPNNVVIRTPEQADASRPIPISNSSATINGETLTGVARNVVVSETEGKSRYYALSLNLQKTRGLDNYAYRLNYTLSSLKNDTEDINFRASDSNNFGREWGPSINDRTHNLNGIFNYYPLKSTSVTLAGLLQSGQPINRIPLGFGTTDLNGDGASFGDSYVGNSDRFPGETRNNDRLPWSVNFDLGIQQKINLNANNSIEIRADIFNIFNAENLSGYSNNATQSNQIQGGSVASGLFTKRNAAPPRQFQFGVSYKF